MNKNNKEPLELLGKISSRYERFMSEFIPDRPKNVIKSVTKKLSSLTARMEKEYNKLNSKCKFYESSDADADSERWKIQIYSWKNFFKLQQQPISELASGWDFFGILDPDPEDSGSGFLILGLVKKFWK